MRQPSEATATELFEGRKHYVIPAYQRPYVWNEEDHEIVRNRWFIKHEVTITNAYDAERNSVFECTVGGTHANPRVKAFSVSN